MCLSTIEGEQMFPEQDTDTKTSAINHNRVVIFPRNNTTNAGYLTGRG